MRVHVEQAGLVGIGLGRGGKFKCAIHRCQQLGAVQMQVIKSAGLDQCFNRALVEFRLVNTHAKIVQRGKRPAAFTRSDDRGNGLLAGALDGAQAVTNALVGDGFKAIVAAVHIG